MDIPKVSVIIPVYNIEQYIEKCLQSVLQQTLQEVEIIVVNDGSTDNSKLIIERLAADDDRVIVINKANGGLSSARNAGLEIANGEYIAHVDGDDWVEKDYLRDAYNKASKFNLDIVITDFFYEYDNNKLVRTQDAFSDEECILDGKQYFNEFIRRRRRSEVWNKLIDIKLYKENDIWHPEGISLGEDLATVLRLYFLAQRIGKVNKAYYHYVQRANSLGKVKLGEHQLWELVEIFHIVEDVYKKDNQMLELLKQHKLWCFMDAYFFNLNISVSNPLMTNMLKECLQLNKQYNLLRGGYTLQIAAKLLRIFPYINTVILIRWARSKILWLKNRSN